MCFDRVLLLGASALLLGAELAASLHALLALQHAKACHDQVGAWHPTRTQHDTGHLTPKVQGQDHRLCLGASLVPLAPRALLP